MRLQLFFVGNLLFLKDCEQFLEDETVFLFDDLSYSFGREQMLISFDHFNQSFHLFFIFFPNLLIALDLKLQAFRMINPVDALSPCLMVIQFLENLLKLLLGRHYIILLRVDHQIIVLREERNQSHLLLLHAPRQLLQKTEQLILVNRIPLGQTAHVYDGMQGYIMRFQFLQNLLANDCPVVDLVQARDVQDAEADLLSCHFEGSSVVVVDLGGDFLETVGHLDGRIAGKQLGGGRLARPRAPDDEQVVGMDGLHSVQKLYRFCKAYIAVIGYLYYRLCFVILIDVSEPASHFVACGKNQDEQAVSAFPREVYTLAIFINEAQ